MATKNAVTGKRRVKWSRAERGLLWASGILLILGIAGFFLFRNATEEFPTPNIPTPTLPSPNAYDIYLKASKQITGNPLSQPGKPTSAQMVAALPKNLPALKTFRAGMTYPFHNPPQRSLNAPMATVGDMGEFRGLARLLLLEGQVREIQKNYGGAANAYLDCIRLGTDVPRGGVLISALVGIACEAMGRRSLWELTDKLTAADARAAAKRLEQLCAARYPFADTIQEDKWFGQATLLEILRQNPSLTSIEGVGTSVILAFYSKKRIFEDHSAYFDAIIAQMRQPYSPNVKPIAIPNNPIIQALGMDVFLEAQFKDWDVRVQSSLLTATLALRAYYLEKEDYPPSLSVLVSDGYLTKAPNDPFAGTGPLMYRRISEKKYALYSIGPDGKDDGGKPIVAKRDDGTPKRWVEAGMVGDFVPRVNTY